MLLLGIDLGTSSVKVSVLDSQSGEVLGQAIYPDQEATIFSDKPGWAEQSPEDWWEAVQIAIKRCHYKGNYQSENIAAIGIAYQMHGLVIVDKDLQNLRKSIIWCDSRAVHIGKERTSKFDEQYIREHILNSPANFTAAKLAWVKTFEPAIYAKVDKMMLPGDYIAMKLTGEITTTSAALSEAILWDFKAEKIAQPVLDYLQLESSFIPSLKNVFGSHGQLKQSVAEALSLKKDIPVTYKAGDQPNNALALHVNDIGEVAATGGTSGVIYALTDRLVSDEQSRVNTFAHVNHRRESPKLGVLLCINGTGSANRFIKNTIAGKNYETLNVEASKIKAGSEGLLVFPFGNGAERMLNNMILGGSVLGLDFNKHDNAHLYRATQEGIAFAFRYGLDILKENGVAPAQINAGNSNLFRSQVFSETLSTITGIPIALFQSVGSLGAAIGAGIGAGLFKTSKDAIHNNTKINTIEPQPNILEDQYQQWKQLLQQKISAIHSQ